MKSFNSFSFRMGLVCLLATIGFQAQATTFTLNNNNPTPGQHSTFAAAQTAASSGDTILVHGSPNTYGSITISKSIVLIGPGHRPRVDLNLNALFGTIDISASNVKIHSIQASGIGGAAGVSNINIENCFLLYTNVANNGSNWLIKNNIFNDQSGGTPAISLVGSTATNVIITNNIINSTASLSGFGGTASKIVANNIFTWSGAGTAINGSANNVIFENNIFYGSHPNAGTQTNCVYNNNLTFGNTINTLPPAGQSGSANLVNVNPLFVNTFTPPSASAFSYLYNYRLQAASPAKGTGTNGTDMGVYQSTNEFSMTGEPARPQTTVVNMNPAIIPAGGTTTVNFTIRKSTPNAQ